MEPNAGSRAPHNATLIAQMFTERYYKVLEVAPHALYRFYNDESTVSVHGLDHNAGATPEQAVGLGPIAEKFSASSVKGAVATTLHLDAQRSASGGILLQVSGSMKIQGLDHKFTQSFFLAPQEKGYFVLNDILRIEAAHDNLAVPASAKSGVQEHVQETPQLAPVASPPPSAPAVSANAGRPFATSQKPLPPPPHATPALPEPAPGPVHDVEVPQPAKQATPPRPVAPPAANLSYAQLLKLGSPAAAGPGVFPTPATIQPPPATGTVDSSDLPTQTNGHPPPKPVQSPVFGVFCKGLPQDEVTVEMIEAEFSKFGPLAGGKQGITIQMPKFGSVRTAQIRFEDAAAVELALKAEVVMAGKRLNLSRLRPDFGPPPRGGGSGPGRGGVRNGSGGPRGGPRGPNDTGGRAGRGERPEGYERPHRTGDHQEGGSQGPREQERPGSGSGRDDRGDRPRGDRRPGSNSRRGPGGRRAGGSGGGSDGMSKSSSKDDVAVTAPAAEQ